MPHADPLFFVVDCPQGVHVRGVHDSAPAPVYERLQAGYAAAHAQWLAKIASKSGAFDGHRAVLQAFSHEAGILSLETAYRSYAQGRALHDAWSQEFSRGLTSPPAGVEIGASWGMALVTLILLPYDHVLCAQRSPSLLVNPGVWTAAHTEVIEPGDIDERDMAPLLHRLRDEELPCLAGLGTHKFVGLGVRASSYTWQLVAVLDLRKASFPILQALSLLKSDVETAAWCAWPLSQAAKVCSAKLPANLSTRLVLEPPMDVELAQAVAAKL